MGHYYRDVIHSLSSQLDTINDQLIRGQQREQQNERQNEQPRVFKQNEVDTCDTDGGPWFEQYVEKLEACSHAK